MFEHKKIQKLNDYFIKLNNRTPKGVYFYRINSYNEQIESFIKRYYDSAILSGVVMENKIPNPNEKNLSYYDEIMGMEFLMDINFIETSMKKWLPRINDFQIKNLSLSFYNLLMSMHSKGKNDSIIKNSYIKFMCWLYYKFERIVNRLGENDIPKLLYEGEISYYELLFFSALSNAGCDVLILQYNNEENYLRLDPKSELSDAFVPENSVSFPENFNLKQLRNKIQDAVNSEIMYGEKPSLYALTNLWTDEKGIDAIKINVDKRGKENNIYYNCFYRINGVEDKVTYLNELYQFYSQLKNNRKLLIINKNIPNPATEEIASIKRKNYNSYSNMIADISLNISYSANSELKNIMKKAFVDIMLEESKSPKMNINRLTNKAVYVLCWLKRYIKDLFYNWKTPEIACCIYMGGCKNENEALFIRFLSKLPIDVLILVPDLNLKCVLEDKNISEINYNNSLSVDKFPKDDYDLRMTTAAYYAERELDEILYQDSGMFKNMQYKKANIINLQTIYEEIEILWNQEVKYRPNFNITNNTVNIPVIFANILGVKDGDTRKYWKSIKSLVNDDTLIINYIKPIDENSVKAYAVSFFKNGKLLKNKIKSHKCYKYSFLREDIQEYILEKLEFLINQKYIKGTFENGMEYTIISIVLNMPNEILRLIQKFDFTKKNPKLIYINTNENLISLEKSVLIAFLHLVGFDALLFAPTGYQNAERFFNIKLMEEHQIGNYMYDLIIPNMDVSSLSQRNSWFEKWFKKGR